MKFFSTSTYNEHSLNAPPHHDKKMIFIWNVEPLYSEILTASISVLPNISHNADDNDNKMMKTALLNGSEDATTTTFVELVSKD